MGTIPHTHRAALRAVLDDLVDGRRPDLMAWVQSYGQSGATLVAQPEEIWEHPWADYQAREDGSAHVVVPLWTVAESPSDLSAECELGASGAATILDVHVL